MRVCLCTGRIAFISSVMEHPESGFTFLGSSQNPHLGRVRLPGSDMPANLDDVTVDLDAEKSEQA